VGAVGKSAADFFGVKLQAVNLSLIAISKKCGMRPREQPSPVSSPKFSVHDMRCRLGRKESTSRSSVKKLLIDMELCRKDLTVSVFLYKNA
jgi:hypothetical protein